MHHISLSFFNHLISLLYTYNEQKLAHQIVDILNGALQSHLIKLFLTTPITALMTYNLAHVVLSDMADRLMIQIGTRQKVHREYRTDGIGYVPF